MADESRTDQLLQDAADAVSEISNLVMVFEFPRAAKPARQLSINGGAAFKKIFSITLSNCDERATYFYI